MESPQDINLIKQVTTLVADVRNLKEGQDAFHQEVKESFKKLEDNYAKRLDGVEAAVKGLESRNNWYTGALAVIGIVSVLVTYIYISQQTLQDQRIQNLIQQVNKI